MSIVKKVRAVEKVFQSLEKEINQFQNISKLSCINGCHYCCSTNNIQANPLEFLPLAYHLYKTNQAYEFLEKLEQNSHQKVCALFNPFNSDGACLYYLQRGLICRLFGFSGKLNRSEMKELVTCKVIKTQKHTEYNNAIKLINNGTNVPMTSKYYMKLYSIDLRLASTFYPINEAIKIAIETVLFHYSFRNKRAS